MVSFPVMAYGYTAHTDYLGIYTDMRRPTITRMLRVTDSVGTGWPPPNLHMIDMAAQPVAAV